MSAFLRTVCVLSSLLFFDEVRADIVVLGGFGSIGTSSDAPNYPIADTFSIGDTSTAPILLPNTQGIIVQVAVDSYRGAVIYVGVDGNDNPLILQGSVVSQEVKSISVPTGLDGTGCTCAAIDSDGTAIIGGGSISTPIIFRLLSGATEATQISIPSTDQGIINRVAIAANNIAILVGRNDTTGAPIIYALPSGANEAIPVSLPNPSITGSLNAIAVGPDGTAILGGQNAAGNGEALIYRLPAGSLSANEISIPDPNDGGMVNGIAIGPNNTAILVGSTGTPTASPLIYQVTSGSNSASIIANANEDDGSILDVAIGSDGTAILGGTDDTTQLPLIYKLAPGASQAASIQLPNATAGQIISVAIGSENIAVLGGVYNDSNQTLIFTLPLGSSAASAIQAPSSINDEALVSVVIYSYDGLYDIRRLRPYYYLQKSETIDKLNQSGL